MPRGCGGTGGCHARKSEGITKDILADYPCGVKLSRAAEGPAWG